MPQIAVKVALLQALKKPLTYLVPPQLADKLQVGTPLIVPLGNGSARGYVVEILKDVPENSSFEIKEIKGIAQTLSPFPPSHIQFLMRAASYYQVAVGELLLSSLPPNQKGQEKYRLAANFADSLAKCRLGSSEEAVIALLKEGRAVSQLALSRQLKKPLTLLKPVLKRLLAKNLLEVLYAKESGPRIVRTVKALYSKELEKMAWQLATKAPKAIELWRSLPQDEEKALASLGGGGIYAKVNWLQERGFVECAFALLSEQGKTELSIKNEAELAAPLPLNNEQKSVLKAITDKIDSGFSPFLLHGVTGSGKTEVYMQAIAEVLAKGKKALVLVPEIALTPQTRLRFMLRFGEDRIGLWHSELSAGARLSIWERAARGELDVLVGARSALFVPMANLGMVVVDEEHDYSYKQGEEPRYNGRDLALLLAQVNEAVAILGSATPSLESYHNSLQGKYCYLALLRRAVSQTLPLVETVDMRREVGKAVDGQLSQPLINALADNLERHEQSLIFLNRRGFAPYVICQDCGYNFTCPNCAVGLTFHQKRHLLKCHYCGYEIPMPDKCPTCKGERLLKLGLGTERLEDTIQRLFPTARLARLDRDTAASRQRLEEVLAAVQAGQVDILLGTQMVSKGHDFPKVTLVGVVQADAALNFPDFRAAERTFQLLTQVAGRAGRGELPGRVLVQTFDPENFAIKAALKHDCRAFWNRELAIREEVGYPPFTHLAMLRFEGEEETPVSASAQKVAELLNRRIAASNLPAGFITILGPTPAPIARINGKYRYQLLIKCQKRAHVGKIISDIDGCVEKNVHLIVDIDPVDML